MTPYSSTLMTPSKEGDFLADQPPILEMCMKSFTFSPILNFGSSSSLPEREAVTLSYNLTLGSKV